MITQTEQPVTPPAKATNWQHGQGNVNATLNFCYLDISHVLKELESGSSAGIDTDALAQTLEDIRLAYSGEAPLTHERDQ